MRNLLIVESPGKIKKLQDILGPDWTVAASCGHIRDLPEKECGVAPPSFKPDYVITKKDVVNKLKGLADGANVFLASDPDREGEAIAWHLKETLKLKSYKRVTYQSITKDDVEAGIASPREIDDNLVRAQEARRVLDRFVGWKVSGPLSEAVGEAHMSAGRVQSPAVRIVVDRENEIKNFVSTTHFGVELIFDRVEAVSDGWKATWLPKEGWLKEDEEYFLNETLAKKIAALRSVKVLSCDEKEKKAGPPAPFTTSSLQQAASNALHLKPKRTMELAQKLYEGGHITYMRTDSPNLSDSAIKELRQFCDAKGLPLAKTPRTWKSKAGAQEAHECIRPTHFEVEDVKLESSVDNKLDARFIHDASALYKLIWTRAVASQLADAIYDVRTVRLSGDVDGKEAVFEARGRTLREKGWKILMDHDDANADEEEEAANPVPAQREGATLTVISGDVKLKKTKPAPRYTEATLIREMEKLGIGRPATYAAIMDTISSRQYVKDDGKGRLMATPRGEKLVYSLFDVFAFLDLAFTSKMEEQLDLVAQGKLSYLDCVSAFYNQLSEELKKFMDRNMVPCPSCGDRETFRHILNKEKGWNFWGCRKCEKKFEDENGRPGAEIVRGGTDTDFTCEKCGKPIKHLKGTSRDGKPYDFFACSDRDCGTRYDNVDGKPVLRKPGGEDTDFSCPDCGSPLRHVHGDRGKNGKPYDFFACSNKDCPAKFDNVDGKPVPRKPQGESTEYKCPKCGSPLLLKTSKAGNQFYGCSGYPKCKAMFWKKKEGDGPDFDNPPKER